VARFPPPGTELRAPGGARDTLHVSYRRAGAEWATRRGWADVSHDPAWYDLVARATVRQLRLLGFPPPGHPFWTDETLAAMGQRSPASARATGGRDRHRPPTPHSIGLPASFQAVMPPSR
jgi:hypothetical protein